MVACVVFEQFLLALMLCSRWWGRHVLLSAHVLFQTTCSYTDAAFSLAGALCTGGGPCFFNNPFLTVMLYYHWWGRFALMVAHAVLQTTAFGTYAVFSLMENLCTASDQHLEAIERGALELVPQTSSNVVHIEPEAMELIP